MNIIELNNITKTFGSVVAVKDLSLTVPKGSIYGFIGPNGSGKTTTIRMIMKIFYPDSGEIKIHGNHRNGIVTDNIGYLPEDRGLYKKMKVNDILMFMGELGGGSDLRTKIRYWLNKLDLATFSEKKVETLSKGMTQKLQFIATIINEPEIIILDEPFSGLDPVNAEILKDVILDLQKKGSTIIFSTHDMGMAEKMCDNIFMIYKGEKVLDGTLYEIQDRYGADTLVVQTEKGESALTGIRGISKINNYGKLQELKLEDRADPQKILAEIMKNTAIKKFEITRPSLNDIFIRIAAPDRKEVNHA
ncbi:MAG: ATP-binding cassette domain-containing protein [Bacteroidales bacterium]|nr:ATP-binding cassette domain-containing protein [Bacteroidales bacterium]